FNVARVDLHHPGYEVSVFASSVVPGENSDLHNALPGNNMYGVYGSFQNIVPNADFDYDTEFDGQTGSLGASSIAAWAGYASVGKTFRKVAAAPHVFLEGNYASGTKNPNGRKWNTFDQLYPSNHDKLG